MAGKETFWGFDVGMATTTLAVVDGSGADPAYPIVYALGKAGSSDLGSKLIHLHDETLKVAQNTVMLNGLPRAVRVERQTGRFIKPHSHYAAGVVILALHRAFQAVGAEVPVSEVSPGTWKKQAVGHGNADKDQVMAWALGRARPDAALTQDAADAIAIAESTRVDSLAANLP